MRLPATSSPKWMNVSSEEGAAFLLAYVRTLWPVLKSRKKGIDKVIEGPYMRGEGTYVGEKMIRLTARETQRIRTEINSVKGAVNRWKRHEQILAA